MNYYESNLAVLREKHPLLETEILEQFHPSPELTILDTVSGFPSAIFHNIYVHSRHNPKQEATRLIRSRIPENVTCCVFLGFGLGYYVESFLEIYPEIPVIIVEPAVPFFLKSLTSRPMTQFLNNPGISFLLNAEPSAIPALLHPGTEFNLQVVKLRSVYQEHQHYFQLVENALEAFLSRKEINRNTLKRFGKLWVRNLVRNTAMIGHTRGVASLAALLPYPALVLAAGPSLDQIVPHLSQLKQRFVLIAVDTSLRACLDVGVEPDFLVVVDPQYWNTRHLDGLRLKKTIIISESSTHPRVFRMFSNPVLFCASLFPLGQYLEKLLGNKGKLGTGGSVATTAWDFARLLGATPIFCAGLDLGFPLNQTHFSGSYFEELTHISSFRLHTAETMAFLSLYDAAPFFVENNQGDRTRTDKRLVIYKKWFEQQIAKERKPIESFNLSPAGVKIEGMRHVSLTGLGEFPEIRPEIDRRIDNFLKKKQHKTTSDQNKIKAGIRLLIEELNRLENLSGQGLEQLEIFKKRYVAGESLEDSLNALNSIDAQILGSASSEIIGFLVYPLANKILAAQTRQASAVEILSHSQELYGELKNSCLYHQQLLSRFSLT